MNLVRPIALVFLALAAPLVVVAAAVSSHLAESVGMAVVMAVPVAVIAAAVGPRIRRAAAPLLAVLGVMEASGFALLALRDGGSTALVVLLGGLWLVPLLALAIAYARTFAETGITEADLQRMDAASRRTERG
jgi:hypothetical protein